MNRRNFLRAMGAGAAALSFPSLSSTVRAQTQRPNVLFISIDDLNDWVGCLGGHPDTLTPNIDRLAGEGVLFSNAHSSASSCNPSRTSLLTGTNPSTNGVYENTQSWYPLLNQYTTLPRHFRNHGYRACRAGKIYHTDEPDLWYAHCPTVEFPKPPYYPMSGLQNPVPRDLQFDWGPIDIKDEDMRDYAVVSWAMEELGRSHREPFFLAVGLGGPHLPWYAPRQYYEKFSPERISLPTVNLNDLDDVPEIGRSYVNPRFWDDVTGHKQWRKAVAGYLAAVNIMDAMLGRLLDKFYDTPYVDNTIIVFWSDQGFHLGEKTKWRKFSLWEETTHIPLIISAPEVTQPGGVCEEVVSLLDIYPTLNELCDLSPLHWLEGESLLPQLMNPRTPRVRPAISTRSYMNHSVRSKRWRYIRYIDNSEELYDHDIDPLEWRNLADEPGYEAIKAELAQWLPTLNMPPI